MLNVVKAKFPFLFHIEVSGSDSSHHETIVYSRVILNKEGDYIPLSEEGKEIVTKANKAYGVEASIVKDFPHTETLESLGYDNLPVFSFFHGGLQELYYATLESGVPTHISYLCYGGREEKDIFDYSYEETLITLPNGSSCIVVEDHEKEEMYFAWFFPGKEKEVWLGKAQSLALLKGYFAVPLFLLPEEVKNFLIWKNKNFPTYEVAESITRLGYAIQEDQGLHASFIFEGNEMALHYAIFKLKRQAEELDFKSFCIEGFNEPNKYEALLEEFHEAHSRNDYEKAQELFKRIEGVIPSKDATWLALKVKLEGINPKLDNIENW